MKNKLGLIMAVMVVAGWMQVGLGQNSTYQIIEGSFTWHEAKADAEAKGGHLAVITSQRETVKIGKLLEDKKLYHWIGSTDENSEGKWEWITGETWTYENWLQGDPNNHGGNEHYGVVYSGDGDGKSSNLWVDAKSDYSNIDGYILEIPKLDLDQGLVAYYPFNGNANDESGNGNHGTVFSAENTADRKGADSSAYKVSKGKRIELPANDDIIGDKSRTISIWLKNTNSYRAKPFVYGTLSPGKAFGIVYDNRAGVNKWEFWAHYPDHQIGTVDKEWRLHTITYHNGTITYYIDGLLKKGETNWFGAQPRLNTSKTKIYIGSGISFDPDWSYFDGKVDDIRIYNRALSENEVADLHELEKPREPKNIITSQPQSGSFAKGSTITIKVGIDDSYDSPFVQWFKNGQPLPGENSAELTIINSNEKNGGDYYALISAGGKAETSVTAKVTILSLPEITAISENTVADEGETIELTVAADGTAPLSYKWKKVGDDSILSTSSNLVLKKVDEDDAGSYVVVVSSEGGEVTSPAVILGIRPDTDNDGLLDYIELDLGSDINKADTDGDGLSDFNEVDLFSTSPIRSDTDGDGLDDGTEIRGGFDPRKPTESADGSISIKVAVELEFFTLTWNNYQLQRSKDLIKWQDVDALFKGVGGYSSILQPARKDKIYWRLIIVD